MSRVLTITDTHIRITKPENRREADWLDVCIGQVEQAFALAEKYECSAVVCSGDLGDSPNWSPKAMVRFIELCKRYPKIPFITTLGQHDVFGHNIDTWKDSSVGVLEATGIITVLRHGQHYLINDDLAVYGFAFGEAETVEFLRGQWHPPVAHKNRFKLALVHATVGATETMGWAGISNQNLRNVDLASFGDIHDGFEVHHFDETDAYSTGSLTRSSIADKGRVPSAGLLEVTDENWNLSFLEVFDGHDVDVFVEGAASIAYGDTAAQFKEALQTAFQYKDEPPLQKVQRVGAAGGFTDRQINLVVERLAVGEV